MSFDLYFCWRKEQRIDFGVVKDWAINFSNFKLNDSQLWYSEPKTGVYFSLDFQADPPEDPLEFPQGYYDSGMSFNLNYNRPSYFGFEAMPYVERFATHFGLSVFNPQDEPELITNVASESLLRSWIKHNERATITMIEHAGLETPPTMPAASAMYLWKYTRVQVDLQNSCGPGIYVPRVVPVCKKGSHIVGRATTCTEDVPMILPEVEWVFIVRTVTKFLRPKRDKDVSAVSSETFRDLLKSHIRPFEWTDLSVQLIGPESVEHMTKIIRRIDRSLPRSEFEIIARDSFVDIEFPRQN